MNENHNRLIEMFNTWSDGPKLVLICPRCIPLVASVLADIPDQNIRLIDSDWMAACITKYPKSIETLIICSDSIDVEVIRKSRLDLSIRPCQLNSRINTNFGCI